MVLLIKKVPFYAQLAIVRKANLCFVGLMNPKQYVRVLGVREIGLDQLI